MVLEVLATDQGGNVYLDITREGQTLSTRALPIQDGRASAAVDLTPDLYGTLSLHAYRIAASGEIVRDTRLVVVDAPVDLALDIRLDRMAHASELIDLIRDTDLPFQEVPVRIQYTEHSLAKGQSARGALRIVLHYLIGRVLR